MHETINETINRTDRVLSVIRENNRLTREQLAKQVGISKGTLARELASLKKQNKIRRVGSNKSGHWEMVKDIKKRPNVEGPP